MTSDMTVSCIYFGSYYEFICDLPYPGFTTMVCLTFQPRIRKKKKKSVSRRDGFLSKTVLRK